MDEMLRAAGEKKRRAVLGDVYVDQALGSADEFSRPFQDLLARAVRAEIAAEKVG